MSSTLLPTMTYCVRCEFYVKCQRRVKTEDLGVFEAFSVGDITVRKANDPSCMV
jgi:hypothetical protein